MAFSKKIWAKARALYESGKFDSIDTTYKAFQKWAIKAKNRPKIPTLVTVRNHAKREQWDRGANEDKILDAARGVTEEMFARHGAPRDKRVEMVAKGILTADPSGNPYVEASAAKIKELVEDGWDVDKWIVARRLWEDLQSDLNVAVKYLKEGNAMIGDYAPKETKLSGRVGVSHSIEPDGRTLEQVGRSLAKMFNDIKIAYKP